jgi:sporulation protein YlmC with PRC-barrel domain
VNAGHSLDTTFFSRPARSTSIIGKTVDDFQGRKLGKVRDVAVDMENGRVVEVIVAQESIWGGEKRVEAVPPDVLTATRSGRIVYSGLNKKELSAAPAVELSRWNDAVAQPRIEAAYQYFGETPYFLVPEHAAKDANESATHPLGTVRRASEIIGTETVNNNGERLGKVEDLVVDLGDSRLVEVVIDTSAYLGMDGALSAVPPQALRVNSDRTLGLDTSRDRLDAAPRFSEKAWPEFDREQIVSVYQAYHVLPYLLPIGIQSEADNAPQSQKLDQADADITTKISNDIQAAEGLSPAARQVSVTTQDGRVTLRGAVASLSEKIKVGEIAARTVAAAQINNQIEIKNTVVSASN